MAREIFFLRWWDIIRHRGTILVHIDSERDSKNEITYHSTKKIIA